MRLKVVLIGSVILALHGWTCRLFAAGVTTPEEWTIEDEVKDEKKFFQQARSQIRWEEAAKDDWLDFKKWRREKEQSQLNPAWRTIERVKNLKEPMGKVLSCKGECLLWRGDRPVKAQYRTQIYEGDDFTTSKDSAAWILLKDGTMLRFSPETQMSFLEINFSANKVLHLFRIHQGLVYSEIRTKSVKANAYLTETDQVFLPVLDLEANREHFYRQIFKKELDPFLYHLSGPLKEKAAKKQEEVLTQISSANSEFYPKMDHEFIIISPNATLHTVNKSWRFFYKPLQRSLLKTYDVAEIEKSSQGLYLRGYKNEKQNDIESNSWYEVTQSGREFSSLSEVPEEFNWEEFFTSRMTTLLLMREREILKSREFFEALVNKNVLAEKFGFYLWGEELSQRVSYLLESTRRLETTHLSSLEKLRTLDGVDQNSLNQEFSQDYQTYLKINHAKILQGTRDDKKRNFSFMTDQQFLTWILVNGKP